MLGKLIKYEFKATGRLLLPVYGALLLMGGVVNLGLTLQGKLPVLKFAQGVLIFAYVALMVAAFALSFFVVISRFYKNLICDEGYLMFTLPVKAGTHLLAKTVVSTVWSVGTCLVAVGSLLLWLGNGLPKARRESGRGVKAPAALIDRENWRHTQRFGGRVWFACGLASLLAALLPAPWNGAVPLAAVLAAALLPRLYSALFKNKQYK